MKYFIAVVPPKELAMKIVAVQALLGQSILPPHITVKAPNSLPDSEWWLPEVAALCKRISPIHIVLDGLGQFASTVLYWRVVSPDLVKLHNALLSILNPPLAERSAYFEGPAYVPHLTLLHAGQNQDSLVLDNAKAQAAALGNQPTEFIASQVRIFKAAESHQPYQPYVDIPLAGPT